MKFVGPLPLFKSNVPRLPAGRGDSPITPNSGQHERLVPSELRHLKNQCEHAGWKSFGSMFEGQGDCVRYIATDGKNPPSG